VVQSNWKTTDPISACETGSQRPRMDLAFVFVSAFAASTILPMSSEAVLGSLAASRKAEPHRALDSLRLVELGNIVDPDDAGLGIEVKVQCSCRDRIGAGACPQGVPEGLGLLQESTHDRLPSAKKVTSEREANAPLSSFSAIR
jgi:hypothetical protein